jgi:hypothetical protein
VSPRKSSTSSAEPPPPRPRYLGIEAAGDLSLSPRALERALGRPFAARAADPAPAIRVIRVEGSRALVRVPHRFVAAARAAWNGPVETAGGATLRLRTHRTYGTLVKGKRWLRARRRPASADRGPEAVRRP